jgi:ketosteroid isomerase-like protein
MPRWISLSVLAAALTVASLVQAAPDRTEDVLKFEADWAQAYAKADLKFLDRAMLPDFTLTDTRGTVTTKEQELAEVRDSVAKYEHLIQHEMKVRFYGSDMAVVIGRTAIKLDLRGKVIDTEVAFTDTLVRKGGLWYAAAGHTSRPGS